MHGLPIMESYCQEVTRREFLLGSAATLAVLMSGCASHVLGRPRVDFAQFPEKLDAMARNLVGSRDPDEETYLEGVEELIQSLDRIPTPVFASSAQVNSASCISKQPVKVVFFRLLPGARIPPHDHRDYNGVVHVVRGSARILSYDPVGVLPKNSRDAFMVKKTHDITVHNGDSSSLARTRDNIHDIQASDNGVLFMDVFTFFKPDGDSTYLKIGDEVGSEGPGIFRAQFIF